MKTFIIDVNDANQRLDKFLQKSVPLMPQSLLYKSIRKKRIKVNGKKADISYRLAVGDNLELYLNDELFDNDSELVFLHVPNNISVVYEDENILIVDKPQGLVVHEDNDNTIDTLINRVLHYLYDKKEYDPAHELSFVPALCNRIDRNTCGIVIVAKTAAALRILNEKIRNREVQKRYLCIVFGTPAPQQATLTHYLEKDSETNKVKLYHCPSQFTKTAITSYSVIKTIGELSLVEVILITGRTHQIRAHMAYIGHPLLGDGKYGNNVQNKRYGYKYQALCSYKLSFYFDTDAGELNYLNGKKFEIKGIPFVEEFFDSENIV